MSAACRLELAALCGRAFDFQWRDRDAISLQQDLIARADLPVAANEKVAWFFITHPLFEELANCGAFGDIDVICKTGSKVVDEKDFHDRNVPLLVW